MKAYTGPVLYLLCGILLAAAAAVYRAGGFPRMERAESVVSEGEEAESVEENGEEDGHPERGGDYPSGAAESAPETEAEVDVEALSDDANLRRIRDGLEDGSFRLIAHRGYSAKAPENTLPAFMAAAQAGFDCVETDLRFTADGHAVLIHNASVDNTSNGEGRVADMTLEELRTLDFGGWYDEEYAGTRIPTLEEGLVLCRVLGLGLYLELKVPDMTGEQYQWVIDTVDRYQMRERTTFLSFYLACLRGIAERDADFSFRFLTFAQSAEEIPGGADETVTDASVTEAIRYLRSIQERARDTGISWNYAYLSAASEQAVSEAGLTLEEWTVDQWEEALSVSSRCTALTTNHLTRQTLLERLRERAPEEPEDVQTEDAISLYRFARLAERRAAPRNAPRPAPLCGPGLHRRPAFL